MATRSGEHIILGLDPGSLHFGFAFVSVRGNDPSFVGAGTIHVSQKDSLPQRLLRISNELGNLVSRMPPHTVVVERVFVGKNVESALRLGYVRGLCLVECARAGAIFKEYSPRSIKKSVTGYGEAQKEQVRQVLESIFCISLTGSFDASDALALAYHEAQQYLAERVLRQQGISL